MMKKFLCGKEDYVLCFAENNFAYFTNKSLDEQIGDDWNDVSYEHNAGLPYAEDENQIIKLAYDGYDLSTPAERAVHESNLSVDMINAGVAPWISGFSSKLSRYVAIPAGINIPDFIEKVKLLDGDIYIPLI